MDQQNALAEFITLGSFQKIMEQAPVAMSVLRGPNFVVHSANRKQLELWQKKDHEILNKELFDIFPEISSQEFKQLLTSVYQNGKTFKATGMPAQFLRNGTLETAWFDFTYEPLCNDSNDIEGMLVVSVEVTDKVLAQQKAEREAAFNRSILENSPDCIKVIDEEGCVQYVNTNGLCRLEIDDFCQVQNKPWWDLWPADSRAKVKESIQQALAGETPQFEAFCPTAKGQPKWWDVRVSAAKDRTGKITQLIAVSRDITDRKKTEETLRQSEELMRLVLDASQTGIWIVDLTSMHIHWSPKHYTIFGVTEFDGRVETFQKFVHPDDLPMVWTAFSAAIEKGGQYHIEFRVVHPSGEVRWVGNLGHCEYDSHGNPIRFLGTVNDITKRKQAEEVLKSSESHFRTLAEALPLMVWTIEADGTISFTSKFWRDYSGREDATSAWNYMIHPDDREEAMASWANHFASRQPYKQHLRLRNRSGEYRWHNSIAEPLFDSEGKLIKWVGALNDVHAEKTFSERLEELVAERTKELKQINEDLQQFVHVSSHDLKEPVRKALVFLSRLEAEFAGNLPDRAKIYLSKINTAARRSSQMIESLIRYSLLDTARLRAENVDLNAVLSTIEEDLELVIAQSDVRITRGQLPMVEGDSQMLHQLFYNLVSNALKFANKGAQAHVAIDSRNATKDELQHLRLSQDEPFICVSLQDNGIGFEPQYAKSIFNTFSRLHPKERYEGVGMGLAICKRIVERHGGAIEAKGQEGGGATFYVYLPVSRRK